MEEYRVQHHQNTLWWITSLAISVICCAILFVVFAGYFVSMKEDLAASKLHYEMIDQRLAQLNSQLDLMYRHDLAGTPKMQPSSQMVPEPLETAPTNMVSPPAAVTTGTTPGTVVTPNGSTVPSAVTPAPASTTAVPEVPSR